MNIIVLPKNIFLYIIYIREKEKDFFFLRTRPNQSSQVDCMQ